MQFIDKQDHLTLLFAEIIEDSFKTLLKFATKLRPGNQRTHIQGQQAFTLDAFRHFAINDPLRQSLSDSGLSHARLSN